MPDISNFLDFSKYYFVELRKITLNKLYYFAKVKLLISVHLFNTIFLKPLYFNIYIIVLDVAMLL